MNNNKQETDEIAVEKKKCLKFFTENPKPNFLEFREKKRSTVKKIISPDLAFVRKEYRKELINSWPQILFGVFFPNPKYTSLVQSKMARRRRFTKKRLTVKPQMRSLNMRKWNNLNQDSTEKLSFDALKIFKFKKEKGFILLTIALISNFFSDVKKILRTNEDVNGRRTFFRKFGQHQKRISFCFVYLFFLLEPKWRSNSNVDVEYFFS